MFWILLILAVNAAEPTPEAAKPMVWTKGFYNSDIKRLYPAEQYRYADKARFDEESKASGYLAPSVRDGIFEKLKLVDKLKGYDQLDKDMLVMDAHHYTPAELKKFHPKLPLRDLAALKEAVRRANK